MALERGGASGVVRRREAWLGTVVAMALTATVTVAVAAAQESSRHGRPFPPEDLGLLEGPDRDAWQKPGQIMDALGIADGAVVADIGAGGGWFTVRLARRVGPNGLVYAEDVQRQMVEAIERRVRREGLGNVRTIIGLDADPRLPEGQLDAVLMVDTYHEVADRVELMRNIAKALKPEGKLGIVDFRNDGWGPGPPMDQRIVPEAVIADGRAAALRLLSKEDFLPYQYLLVFGR